MLCANELVYFNSNVIMFVFFLSLSRMVPVCAEKNIHKISNNNHLYTLVSGKMPTWHCQATVKSSIESRFSSEFSHKYSHAHTCMHTERAGILKLLMSSHFHFLITNDLLIAKRQLFIAIAYNNKPRLQLNFNQLNFYCITWNSIKPEHDVQSLQLI